MYYYYYYDGQTHLTIRMPQKKCFNHIYTHTQKRIRTTTGCTLKKSVSLAHTKCQTYVQSASHKRSCTHGREANNQNHKKQTHT